MKITDVIVKLNEILGVLLPVIVSLGVIMFVWGVVMYVVGGDEEAKTKGKEKMMWGIIGFTVIVSLWGLVSIVVETFKLDNSAVVAKQFINNTASLGGNINGKCIIPDGPQLADILNFATCLITKSIIPLIFSLAVLMFVWGVVQYVISGSNEEQMDKGKMYMMWGIIALTVMVSVWGIVKIVGNTFGIEYVIPQVKSQTLGQ